MKLGIVLLSLLSACCGCACLQQDQCRPDLVDHGGTNYASDRATYNPNRPSAWETAGGVVLGLAQAMLQGLAHTQGHIGWNP